MTRTNKFIITTIAIFSLVIFLYSCCQPDREKEQPYLVMLSLDGFRWDYPNKGDTPNLDLIAENGVKARSLKPCFPSKTFPNHYSMATGLYPDHHGIVLNSFYAPEMDAYYSIMDRASVENPDFYGGEPIWVTAEKQGVISGSYFWVGSETPVQGIRPAYWKKYDHDFPFEQRIDSVIAWLQLPEKQRPHLILWYMHEPDAIGHHYGPESKEVMQSVVYLDSLVGVFIKKLNKLSIADEVNIIVTSDHGMGPVYPDSVIILSEYLDENWFDEIQGYDPNYVLDAKQENYNEAWSVLKNIPHISAWEHNHVPERLHYGNNPRTLDFIVVADSAWSVRWDPGSYTSYGAHGFDNDNTDMHAIFYAMGPAFKKEYTHNTFNNIDLYPLIAHILDLDPAEVDGSLENVSGMVVKK